MSETLSIWNELETTDPKFTKDFGGEKGFRGKAINPTYGMKKLTEVFGACGVGWGTEIVESRFDEGVWLADGKAKINENQREVIHTIILRLWYLFDGTKHEIIGVGTTIFIGKNKYGAYTDGEYFKKSMTDAFTNAAKQLGLSADVFMGLYDDSKYLNEVTNKFAGNTKMPKRVDVKNELEACKDLKDHIAVQDKFGEDHGDGVWQQPSGNGSNKNETWYMLFDTYGKKRNGIPPVDAAKGPDKLIAEWKELASNCKDRETWLILESDLNQNKALQEKEFKDELDRINEELEKVGL